MKEKQVSKRQALRDVKGLLLEDGFELAMQLAFGEEAGLTFDQFDTVEIQPDQGFAVAEALLLMYLGDARTRGCAGDMEGSLRTVRDWLDVLNLYHDVFQQLFVAKLAEDSTSMAVSARRPRESEAIKRRRAYLERQIRLLGYAEGADSVHF
jgi:hypothetical protein